MDEDAIFEPIQLPFDTFSSLFAGNYDPLNDLYQASPPVDFNLLQRSPFLETNQQYNDQPNHFALLPPPSPIQQTPFLHNQASSSSSSSAVADSKLSRHTTSVLSTLKSPSKLLNHLPDILILLSPTGKIQYTSQSIQGHLKFAPNELITKNISEILHPDDKLEFLESMTNMITQQQTEFTVHVRLISKQKENLVFEIFGYPEFEILDFGKKLERFVVSARLVKKGGGNVDTLMALFLENVVLKKNTELLGADLDTEDDEGSKRKQSKKKVPLEELFCHKCGTRSSPEWRKGPNGPKTLCNACGIAYSKMQKKLSCAPDTGSSSSKSTKPKNNGSSSGGSSSGIRL
ncbi:blue light receptor [Nowakowskiella sp. JEL0407]|nr:blue light receptor [Nowakowskiella sp. JEL0407]